MRRIVLGVAAGVTGLCLVTPLRAAEPLDLFDREATPVQHCDGDGVVWLDVPERTYWLKGQRGDGGGYTCRRDAIRSGNRASRD
ncbi:MAG TPA: hypothetical protein VGL83_19030 [Stellaceae bacterium]|jgi:hypothetical protein